MLKKNFFFLFVEKNILKKNNNFFSFFLYLPSEFRLQSLTNHGHTKTLTAALTSTPQTTEAIRTATTSAVPDVAHHFVDDEEEGAAVEAPVVKKNVLPPVLFPTRQSVSYRHSDTADIVYSPRTTVVFHFPGVFAVAAAPNPEMTATRRPNSAGRAGNHPPTSNAPPTTPPATVAMSHDATLVAVASTFSDIDSAPAAKAAEGTRRATSREALSAESVSVSSKKVTKKYLSPATRTRRPLGPSFGYGGREEEEEESRGVKEGRFSLALSRSLHRCRLLILLRSAAVPRTLLVRSIVLLASGAQKITSRIPLSQSSVEGAGGPTTAAAAA